MDSPLDYVNVIRLYLASGAGTGKSGGQVTPRIHKFTWGIKHGIFTPRFFHLATVLVSICPYCLNCTKFGQLVVRKIIKIAANRCHI